MINEGKQVQEVILGDTTYRRTVDLQTEAVCWEVVEVRSSKVRRWVMIANTVFIVVLLFTTIFAMV